MDKVIEKAAKEAGKILLKYFEKRVEGSFKTDSSLYESLVTNADIESQLKIKEVITSLLDERLQGKIGFIGEENLNISGEHLFIIDPLDGTTNFAFGIPYFCISIAYLHNKSIETAIIYEPFANIIYKSNRNKGSFKIVDNKTHKLEIKHKQLKESILAAHYNSITLKEQFNAYKKIIPSMAGVRTMGSVALDLCNFCDNKFNAVICGGAYVWDLAAAKLIVEESGGVLKNWSGNDLEFDFNNAKKQYGIIASENENIKRYLEPFKN